MFQVTRLELVYIRRTYEIEAASPEAAREAVSGGEGEIVDEQIQETHSVAQKWPKWSVDEI